MSSRDESNRSQRNRRTPQQRPTDASRRQSQTWDIDPAEIDRYLSGRPSREEDTAQRTGRRPASSGETADQLSRLQSAVGRRPAQPRDDAAETYRVQPARRERPQPEPEPAPSYDNDEFDAYEEESVGARYADDTSNHGYDDEWEEPAPVRQRQQRRSTPERRTSRSQPERRYEQDPADLYDDTGYDDELYNDDPYLGYEDDRLDRRPPRTPRQRQQVRISKPNLPKVNIPTSISESPLLGDRPSLIMIGVALLSVALMSFVVSDRIGLLGDSIPTHVSASGDPENMQSRDAVWNIPLLAGMVMLMNVAASWFIARIDRFATRFLMAAGLLVHFIAWVALFKYLWE